MRIAILAHSTNPRGGVVHALALGEALVRLGHEATVHAPSAKGAPFFREALCETILVPASPAGHDIAEMVEIRAADYVRHFETQAHRHFDVFHAQDGISGNALATLKERGLIHGFARTVHHIDDFADLRLKTLQRRSITAAGWHFVVSRKWREILHQSFGFDAAIVGNGVDRHVFSPAGDGNEFALRAHYNIAGHPVFLAVGGVEERKNTIRILQAFQQVRESHPLAQLVIAGGASLLDHESYQRQFDEALAASGLPAGMVVRTGPVPQMFMPALYRLADCMVFPSLKEGFGLVVLEAMASGVPVIVSRIDPFTEYLGDGDVIWCDPMSALSIADAMTSALNPPLRARLQQNGSAVAARHDWEATARAHMSSYKKMKELAHA